jgi:hypothetical protein
LNVTLHEVRTVVDRVSTGLDVETVRAKAVVSQVLSLRETIETIEQDRAVRDNSENVRIERVEQRLDDLVTTVLVTLERYFK